VLRQPGVIAIPKASNRTHGRENAGLVEVELTKEIWRKLIASSRLPNSKQALPML